MGLTTNQQKRMTELRLYLEKVKAVEKADFEKWFSGKKEFCVNVGAWLNLIEKDE